ncbi:MAG: hypothetical protein ACHBN1_38595 [Heteroscytonema crispum UTEX LB 1556]
MEIQAVKPYSSMYNKPNFGKLMIPFLVDGNPHGSNASKKDAIA